MSFDALKAAILGAIGPHIDLVKAAVLGLVAWLVAVGPLGAPGSAELALLCWLGGAALVLLVQESPI